MNSIVVSLFPNTKTHPDQIKERGSNLCLSEMQGFARCLNLAGVELMGPIKKPYANCDVVAIQKTMTIQNRVVSLKWCILASYLLLSSWQNSVSRVTRMATQNMTAIQNKMLNVRTPA